MKEEMFMKGRYPKGRTFTFGHGHAEFGSVYRVGMFPSIAGARNDLAVAEAEPPTGGEA